MSWASIGSRGTAQLKTAGADLPFSPSATVAAGRFLVICHAWAQDYTRTPEGANWPTVAIHDTKGNVYHTLGNFSFESNVGIHVCKVDSTITTGDTITLHHRNTIHEPKCLTAWEFSMTEEAWVRYHTPWVSGRSVGQVGADGFSMGLGQAGPQYEWIQEVLIIEAIATMGPPTDTYTADPDYTAMTKEGTTGGGADSNLTIFAQFRIATIPYDTVSFTRDVARNTDTVAVALYNSPVFEPYPRFPLLDDFNRADEWPLDLASVGGVPTGEAWVPGVSGAPNDDCGAGYAAGELAVESNQARRLPAVFGAAAQWLEDLRHGCYAEVYATMRAVGQAVVHFDGSGCGHDATMGGYGLAYQPEYGGYIPDAAWYTGFSGNTGFVAGNPIRTWLDAQPDWRFGMQRDSSRIGSVGNRFHFIHFWCDRGQGWQWMAGWNDVVFGPSGGLGPPIDPPSSHGGKWGLSAWGDILTRLDDFGGGVSACPQFWVSMNWRSAARRGRVQRIHVSDR
jgi:hypothetical protein